MVQFRRSGGPVAIVTGWTAVAGAVALVFVFVVFFLASISLDGPAIGREARAASAQADDLVRRGVELRKVGKDREALAVFQQAVEAARTPRGLGQLGLCEHALGMWIEAEAHLKEALAQERDPWIGKNGGKLRQDLARVQDKIGSIDVWGTPAGARVSVDGHQAATLPLAAPIRALVGGHAVTVEAPGFVPEIRTVTVAAGAASREHVALAASAPPPVEKSEHARPPRASGRPPAVALAAPAPAPDGKAHPEAVVSARAVAPAAAADSEPSPFYKRWWFWTAVGAVVVGGAVSAYLLTRPNDGCPAPPGEQCVKL